MASVIHTRGKIEGVFYPLYLDIISDIFTAFCRATLTKRQMVFASTPNPLQGALLFSPRPPRIRPEKAVKIASFFPFIVLSSRWVFKKHNLLFAYRDAVTH
jgi:hypothetical protein